MGLRSDRMRARWRTVWYPIRFAGRQISIHPTARISPRSVLRTNGGGSITIGAHCEIHEFAMILTYGGHISIGESCSLNPFSIVYGHGGTRIGNGVRIAAHTVIIPANHQRGAAGVLAGIAARGITIGDEVWIAAGCRILDGVSIGSHATIGAGSVVTRSIPERVTAVGAPARPLPADARSEEPGQPRG
jgi:acetyltransferase-like isoleucine patch superfamily enzyme